MKTKKKYEQTEFNFERSTQNKGRDKRTIRAYRKEKLRLREDDTRDEQINFPFYNE